MPRLLAVDREPALAEALKRVLDPSFEVEVVTDAAKALAHALAHPPDAVLYDHGMAVIRGPEFIRALRSAGGPVHRVPVALTSRERSGTVLIEAAYSGAEDVLFKPWDDGVAGRVEKVVQAGQLDGASWPVRPSQAVSALLTYAQRNHLSGTLWLNPGIPFAGSAQFQDGELKTAAFAGTYGAYAFAEMVAFDEGSWRFDDVNRPRLTPAHPTEVIPTEHQDRLLIVDDDELIRNMFCARLEHAGFEVTPARDGGDALERLAKDSFDLVITDLHMPRMDGWELLGRLRSDFRTRELPVIVTTADAELTDALRVAHAGAWDYLSKTEGLTALVHRSVTVLSVRWAADAVLERSDGKEFDLSRVGPWWVLQKLADKRKSGVLSARDRRGTYEVKLRNGSPVTASAQHGPRTFTGVMAIRMLLTSTNAKARFIAEEVTLSSTFRLDMASVLTAVRGALAQIDDAAVLEQIRSDQLVADPELYALFERVGSPRAVQILRAVAVDRIPYARLPAHLNSDEAELRRTLTDLVRRGVLKRGGRQARG